MDRTEIRSEIRSRLQEDVADNWTDAQINRAVDRAVLEFSREERWPWLYTEGTPITLDEGDSTVALPTDIDVSRSFGFVIKDSNDDVVRPLPKRVTPAEGFALRWKFDTAGKPRYYYPLTTVQSAAGAGDETLTQTVRFVPVADANYTVEFQYIRRPSTISADNDEPDMPEDFHEAVVALATASLWLTEDGRVSAVKAGEQMQLYITALDRARRSILSTPEDEELIWGGKSDEAEWGSPLIPGLPDSYGWPDAWL